MKNSRRVMVKVELHKATTKYIVHWLVTAVDVPGHTCCCTGRLSLAITTEAGPAVLRGVPGQLGYYVLALGPMLTFTSAEPVQPPTAPGFATTPALTASMAAAATTTPDASNNPSQSPSFVGGILSGGDSCSHICAGSWWCLQFLLQMEVHPWSAEVQVSMNCARSWFRCLTCQADAELPVWQNDLDYAARLLHMMFAWPTQSYAVDPVLARALEKILILCAHPLHTAFTPHQLRCSLWIWREIVRSGLHLGFY